MMKYLIAALLALPVSALAQSNPAWVDNQLIKAPQWNAQWSLKLDTASVVGMPGDQLSMTKNYSTAIAGNPHQQVNTANITVPVTAEIWNNFDDCAYQVAGGATDASTGTHVVCRYVNVRKYTPSPNVPSMAFIASVVDFTGLPSSGAGPLTGFELDLEAAGLDNQTAFGPNGSRVGMTMNFYPARDYAGNDSVVNAAYAVFGDPARVSFKRLFNAAAAWSVAAIDLTPGTQVGSAATIAMNAGMRVRFAPSRDMYWDAALFGAAGGFHLTGKVQTDELLYSPAGFTAGATITLAGNTTVGVNAASTLGFYGTTAIVKQTPSGACAGNTGCQALRDALVNLGLIVGTGVTN